MYLLVAWHCPQNADGPVVSSFAQWLLLTAPEAAEDVCVVSCGGTCSTKLQHLNVKLFIRLLFFCSFYCNIYRDFIGIHRDMLCLVETVGFTLLLCCLTFMSLKQICPSAIV